MAKGFLYLVAIMDWVSPAVLAWRLLNTLGADVCIEALEEALARYGRPEIFNTCKRCGGASGEDEASPSLETPTGCPMPRPNDLNRSLVALDRDSTLIAVIEMSQSTWLVADIVPGINRQPAKNWWQMRRRCSSCCLAGAPRRPRRAMQSIGSPWPTKPAGTVSGWAGGRGTERLWRGLEYEEVHLHAYAPLVETEAGMAPGRLL